MVHIDTTIPNFLKVANRGKVRPPKVKDAHRQPPAPPRIDEAGVVLEAMPADQRAFFDAQIASGGFMRPWLLDPGCVATAWAQKTEKEETRKMRIAALKDLPKPEKLPPGPAFGHATTFVVVAPAPRKPGTRGARVYAEMVAWNEKNPNGTVAQLFIDTNYNKTDYKWDEERGHIKSGVGSAALFAVLPVKEKKQASEKKPARTVAVTMPAPEETVWSGKATKKRPDVILKTSAKENARAAAKKAVREFGKKNIKKGKTK